MSAAAAKGATAGFHLVFGSDEFQVAGAARTLVDKLCPPAEQAFGLETVDGTVELVDDIAGALRRCLEGLRTVGFFGAGKVIWLRDALFLGDMTRLANEEVKARLAELAAEVQKGLLPGQALVISTSRLDKRTAFAKTCLELAHRLEFNVPDAPREADASAREFCADRLAALGLRPASGAVESFLDRCGADRRQIANEVEKLSLYLGGRKEFTSADVKAIVSSTREILVWDLADDYGARDLPSALITLRQLLYQKQAAVGLLMGLESRIRDLLILKDCLQRRWAALSGSNLVWRAPAEADELLAQLGNDPRKLHPFRAGKLAEQAARFSLEELRECHRQMLDTHEKMVSSPVAPEMLLELFLLRTLGGPRAAPAR